MIANVTKVKDAYKRYMRYPTHIEDMARRSDYYNDHPDQAEFMIDFFSVKPGIRPRGAQYFTKVKGQWKRSFVYDNPLINHETIHGYGYPLININRDNIEYELPIFNNIYFFPFIYDRKVLKLDDSGAIHKHKIGLTPIMDIDSLDIDPQDKSKGRHDVLGDSKWSKASHDMIEKFRVAAMAELEEIGIWKKTRLMHSGNGLYIILPDFYGSIEELIEYSDEFDLLKRYLNSQFDREVTHEKVLSRIQLFKAPFTFHNRYRRVSIPINKDNEFAYEIDMSGW